MDVFIPPGRAVSRLRTLFLISGGNLEDELPDNLQSLVDDGVAMRVPYVQSVLH